MSGHIDNWLPAYVLGDLSDAEREGVAAHLQSCGRCQGEEAAMAAAMGLLPLALTPVAPRPEVLAQVLAGARLGSLSAFLGRLARFFDVTRERARELLELVARPGDWAAGPDEGILLFHVDAGPGVPQGAVGLVRVAAGRRFPWHRHVGDERVLVLEGGFQDEDGRIYRAGEEAMMPGGSDHFFTALPDQDCVFAAQVTGGIEFEGGGAIG
jgi:predicted ChrR family anti-sigma factor